MAHKTYKLEQSKINRQTDRHKKLKTYNTLPKCEINGAVLIFMYCALRAIWQWKAEQ